MFLRETKKQWFERGGCMYCLSCGSDLEKGQKKCSFCGQEISPDALNSEEEVFERSENSEEKWQKMLNDAFGEKKELIDSEDIDKKMLDGDSKSVENQGNTDSSQFIINDEKQELKAKDMLEGEHKEEKFTLGSEFDDIEEFGSEKVVYDKLVENIDDDNKILSEESLSMLEGSENKVELDLNKDSEETTKNEEPKDTKENSDYVNVPPVKIVLPKAKKKGISIDRIIYKLSINTKLVKKIAIGVVGLVVVIILITVLASRIFTPNEIDSYANLEKENINNYLNGLTNAHLPPNDRVDELKSINGSSNISINNILLDSKMLRKMGFISFSNPDNLQRDLQIVLDRVFKEAQDSNLNDFRLQLGNIDLFRLKLLRRNHNLNIYMPDIFPTVISLDTSNLQSVYRNLGLGENMGNNNILRNSDVLERLRLDSGDFLMPDSIKNALRSSLGKNSLQVQSGVNHTIRVGTSREETKTVNRYEVTLDNKAIDSIINEVLESVINDENIYKLFVERYIAFLDVLRVMGVGTNELEDIGHETFREYVLSLKSELERYNASSNTRMNVWVDRDDFVVGREVDFSLEDVSGNVIDIRLRFSADGKKDGYSSILFTLDSSDQKISDIEILIEQVQNEDDFHSKTDDYSTTVRYSIGNKGEKGYLSLDFFSSKTTVSETRGSSELVVNFKKDDFVVDVEANGIEAAINRQDVSSKDYNVEFSVFTDEEYSGSFDIKVDTIYDQGLDFPQDSDILRGSRESINLNNIDQSSLNRAVIDFQIGYGAYMRRVKDIFGIEFFLFGEDV